MFLCNSSHFCAVAVPKTVTCKVPNGTETYLGKVAINGGVKFL